MVLKKLNQESEIALRHLQVMETVWENQPIGIFKLAEIMKLPRHKIRYSLRVLEQSGIIQPTQYGAIIKEGSDETIKKMKNDLKEAIERIERMSQMIQKF
jgi:predicted transcriptional regulator